MYRVLLVEDHPDNRELISRRLTRYGWEVLLASDGVEGVREACVQKPDVILMDLGLPLLSGWEASRRLKAYQESRLIPIIALTGCASQGDHERALAAGCDDIETKPVVFDRLLLKMAALAGETRRLGSS